MEQEVQKNQTTRKIFKNPNVEARRRLKKIIPQWKKQGWTLHPFILKIHPKDHTRKLGIPLTKDGLKDSPRAVIEKLSDFDNFPTANAILGCSNTRAVVDVDKLHLFEKYTLPQPYLIVKTGKGEHWYYLVGDLKQSYKLIFGECQFKGTGVFIPGSYHPVSKVFYTIKEQTDLQNPLNFSHIKPFLTTQTQGRFHTQQKDSFKAMLKGSPSGVFEAYHKAREAGQTVSEAMSVAGPSLQKMEFIPDPTPPTKSIKKADFTFETINPDIKISIPESHVNDWLPRQGVVLLTADKAVGKTGVCYLIMKCLTSGEGLKENFFKTKYPVEKTLFCYGERQPERYELLWKKHGGKPDTVMLWRWGSSYKVKRDKHKNWTLENIRKALTVHPQVKLVILDRSDLTVAQNNQFSIRDAGFELDEIAHEHKVLFIITRHTSKPVGTDARAFKEQTSGFKEWQHVPSVCLFLHAHKGEVILFKVYANECTTKGLIKFKWKDAGDRVFIPEYSEHSEVMTIAEIEEKYNKTEKGKREQKQEDIYSLFAKHGRKDKVFKPGTQDIFAVYAISKDRAVDTFNLKERAIYRCLTEKLNGWSKPDPKVGAIWYCPVK